MKIITIAAAVALAGFGSVAAAKSIEGARDIQTYQNAAGDKVAQMPAQSLVDWQALDDQSLAVWTANDKPWLVRVEQPCNGLQQAGSVALTSHDGTVAAGTDAVQLGSEHCKIASIQPVDYSKIVATRTHAARHKPAQHARNKTAAKPGA